VDSARPGTAEARKGTAAARTTTRIGEARFRTTAPGLVELGRRARTPSTTWTHARPSSLKQRRERQRLLPTQQRTVDGLNVVTPLRQRAAQRKGVERAVASRLGDEERSLVAPEKRRDPEHGGNPDWSCALARRRRHHHASAACGAGCTWARGGGYSKGAGERRPQGWWLLSGPAPGARHGLSQTQP
jgi:hypothetical protein